MLCVLVAHLLPQRRILRGSGVPHFTLIPCFVFRVFRLVFSAFGDAIGNACIGDHKLVAHRREVIEPEVGEAEIVAKTTVIVEVNYVLKHRINADGVDSAVDDHTVEYALAPRVLNCIGGMENGSVPESLLLFDQVVGYS